MRTVLPFFKYTSISEIYQPPNKLFKLFTFLKNLHLLSISLIRAMNTLRTVTRLLH